MKCSTENCQKDAHTRGMCKACYARHRYWTNRRHKGDGGAHACGGAPSYEYRDLLSPETLARLLEHEAKKPRNFLDTSSVPNRNHAITAPTVSEDSAGTWTQLPRWRVANLPSLAGG